MKRRKLVNKRQKIGGRLVASLETRDRAYDIWDSEVPGFLLRVRPTNVHTYFYTYRRPQDGRRTRVALGRTTVFTPAQARDWAIVQSAEVTKGKDPALEKKRAQGSILRIFLKEKYGPWVIANRKTGAGTLARIETCFKSFLDKPLSELSHWHLERWRMSRLQEGIAKSTINREVMTLKAALSKAVEWQLLPSSPLVGLKAYRNVGKTIVRYLSPEEESSLMGALTNRDERIRLERQSANQWRADRGRALLPDFTNTLYPDFLTPAVILSRNTGVRQGELFLLSWSQVDLSKAQITVDAATTKNGLTRHIPLNAAAQEALSHWWMQSGSPRDGIVFPGIDGAAKTDLKSAWTKVLTDAEISNLRWHDLRHDFASRLVMAGVDLNMVRDLLGHADITMTLRYAHLSPRVKADAVARLVLAPIIEQGKYRHQVAVVSHVES